MKEKMLIAGAGVMFLSSAAFAGLSVQVPVDVDLVNRIASGDTVSARFDADDDVRIGCGVRIISDGAGGTINIGFCGAEDADGETITCTTLDAGVVDAISYGSDFGFMTFSWDEDDTCTRIGFSNQSQYIPSKKQLK